MITIAVVLIFLKHTIVSYYWCIFLLSKFLTYKIQQYNQTPKRDPIVTLKTLSDLLHYSPALGTNSIIYPIRYLTSKHHILVLTIYGKSTFTYKHLLRGGGLRASFIGKSISHLLRLYLSQL